MSRSCVTKRLRLQFSRFTSFGFLSLAALALILCLVPQNVYAVDVTLAWDPNGEEDLAGYKIFYRQEGQSYNYQEPAWEGTGTTCTIYDLSDNTTHYFVARAFDTSGNESGDSNEVFYQPNRPPVFNTIGAKTLDEGQLLEFTISATDPDTGDVLTYSGSNLPSGATFNAGTQTFSWTPDYTQAGTYPNVTFTVTDDGTPAESDSEAITITVTDVNRAPVLDPVGDKTINEEHGLLFAVTASDPDGDSLTLTASNLPGGAAFTENGDGTGIFSWTPDYAQAGTYPNVTFTVTDDGTPAESDSEEVTITVGNVNRPPVLNTIGAKIVDEGQLVEFTITGSDPDGDNLTYSVGNVPTDANFDAASQTFSWTPGYGAAGNYTVTFTVTDNGSPLQSDSEDVTITVSADAHAPAVPMNFRILGK
jgi:polyisoprenoid-binding protein YceI